MLAIRGDEALVVEQGIDVGELFGQTLGLFGQERVPDRGLRIRDSEHRGSLREVDDGDVIQAKPRAHREPFGMLSSR